MIVKLHLSVRRDDGLYIEMMHELTADTESEMLEKIGKAVTVFADGCNVHPDCVVRSSVWF